MTNNRVSMAVPLMKEIVPDPDLAPDHLMQAQMGQMVLKGQMKKRILLLSKFHLNSREAPPDRHLQE